MLKRVKDEKSLLKKLYADVEDCGKEKIVLFAGHFPLLYREDGAVEALDYWGKFSKYSLELACKAGKHAKKLKKKVEFVFFVDDHAYEEMTELGIRKVKLRRQRLYKERSGSKARLPAPFKKIMAKNGFSEKNVLRHNHGKPGRKDCLYFSEKILRASSKPIPNLCAREYTEFIDDPKYFNKSDSHLIAFIPNRCKEHISGIALNKEIKDLSASHVFLETMNPLATKKQLFTQGSGVSYRRD